MEADFREKTAKSIVIFGSGIALTACAYAAFRYWKRRDPKNIDEGFEPKSIDEGFEDVFKVGYMNVFSSCNYINLHLSQILYNLLCIIIITIVIWIIVWLFAFVELVLLSSELDYSRNVRHNCSYQHFSLIILHECK
jgi:hypothetical protein